MAMNASDIMTPDVITAHPDTPLDALVDLMLENRISGVPVVDGDRLVGIVSESDLLRRAETGTERHRSQFLELVSSTATIAADYVRTHGRKASEVMTAGVVTVNHDTPVAEIANVLETKRIKRVPVLRNGKLVGIVSRANLLRALASKLQAQPAPAQADDRSIRNALFVEFRQHKWASQVAQFDVTVADGVAHLWGVVRGEDHRRALIVMAENTPGVKRVEDHLDDITVMTLNVPLL
jgi:CBS domain-containing protein